MNSIKNYFSTMPDSHRLLVAFGSLIIFWLIENRRSILKDYRKLFHFSHNSYFIFTAIPVQILLGVIIIKVTGYNEIHKSGFIDLSWLKLQDKPGLQCLVAFVALDFLEYWYHITMHYFKRFWMIHIVHHSDTIVDVSTTLREHPLETMVRLSYLILFLYLTGTEYWMLMIRQSLQVFSNVFAHANFRIPYRLNRWVGLLFITPNLHHVHHHNEMPYTNANYGDVLSIWDRIFGTFRELETERVVFGVDTFNDIKVETGFVKLLKIPFGKYRPTPKKY